MNDKSNGISKKLFISCLKEATKTAILLLQRIQEQQRVLQLKLLLEKEENILEKEEEPEEETLSMKLNKADKPDKKVEEVASEDFAKLMNLLSSDDKQSAESKE